MRRRQAAEQEDADRAGVENHPRVEEQRLRRLRLHEGVAVENADQLEYLDRKLRDAGRDVDEKGAFDPRPTAGKLEQGEPGTGAIQRGVAERAQQRDERCLAL